MRSFESGIESWILSYLLNSLWQIPLLFTAGWVAARALRKVGSAAEHRVWVSVLVLQALLSACSTLPPGWLSTLFAWGRSAHPAGEAHVSVVMGAGTGQGAFHLPAGLLTTIAIAYCAVIAYFAVRFLWRWRKLGDIRVGAAEVVLTGEAALDWEQCAKRFGIDE